MKIDELIALLESGSERGNEYDDDLMRKAAETIRVLTAVPAADVAPVVHAHYIINADGEPRCSACGAKYIDSTRKYCSDCGAIMDGADMWEQMNDGGT